MNTIALKPTHDQDDIENFARQSYQTSNMKLIWGSSVTKPFQTNSGFTVLCPSGQAFM